MACDCQPLRLTVEPNGSISQVAGGPLEEPVDTGIEPWLERAEDLTVAERLNDLLMNNAGGSTVGNDLNVALKAVAKRIMEREMDQSKAEPPSCPCGAADNDYWHTSPPGRQCLPRTGPANNSAQCLHHKVGDWTGAPRW